MTGQEVPFTRIGPTQQARIVIQIIGKDGPYSNPQNIRYVNPLSEPDLLEHLQRRPVPTISRSITDFVTSVSGLNLIASAANLVATGLVYRDTRQMLGKLRRLERLSIEQLESLFRVEQKLDVIDTKQDWILQALSVADRKLDWIVGQTEDILREIHHLHSRVDDLKSQLTRVEIEQADRSLHDQIVHVMRLCLGTDFIDLEKLKMLDQAMEKFVDKVPGYGFGCTQSFQLNQDVRDKLEDICVLLFNLRRTIARAYNVQVEGDPDLVIKVDSVDDYVPWISGNEQMPPWLTDQMKDDSARLNLTYGVAERATIGMQLSNCLPGEVLASVVFGLDEESAQEIGKEPFAELSFHAIMNEMDSEERFQERTAPFSESLLQELEKSHPQSVGICRAFSHLFPKRKDADKRRKRLEHWPRFWLAQTDMGLVWRVHKELKALDNYESQFPQFRMAELPATGQDRLLIDCSIVGWGNAEESTRGSRTEAESPET